MHNLIIIICAALPGLKLTTSGFQTAAVFHTHTYLVFVYVSSLVKKETVVRTSSDLIPCVRKSAVYVFIKLSISDVMGLQIFSERLSVLKTNIDNNSIITQYALKHCLYISYKYMYIFHCTCLLSV